MRIHEPRGMTGFELAETVRRPSARCAPPYPSRRLTLPSRMPDRSGVPENDRESGEEVFVHKDGHLVAFMASPIRDETGSRSAR